MRFYTKQHQYYCGIDLHARTMYLCILDREGNVLIHKNMKTDPNRFLKIIAPYRDDMVISVECMFARNWSSYMKSTISTALLGSRTSPPT